MEKVTIKDVAKKAGVSISTVSNALNDVDVLTPETKRHVLKVAEELHYIPDLRGKNLKARNTKMIGFFTTSVSGAYFHVLVESMAQECEKNGYGLNIFVTKDKQVITNQLFGGSIDGAVLFTYDAIEEREVALIENRKIKTVFLDREIQKETIGSALFDSYQAGYEATHYLLNLGHQKIVYIEGTGDTYGNTQRKLGYLTALKEHGIPKNSNDIIRGYYEKEAAYHAVKNYIHQFPKDLPDAFLAGNDLSAIGCIESLETEGLKVPKDMSVMGFDDIEIAKYFKPSLTTVQNPIARQGVLAVQNVVEMIEGTSEGKKHKLQSKIIDRDSTSVRIDTNKKNS